MKYSLGSCCTSCFVFFLLFLSVFAIFYAIDAESNDIHTPLKSRLAVIDDKDEDILVTMHISDIHIYRHEPEMCDQFIEFCDNTIPGVNPQAVFVTGDMTDGMRSGAIPFSNTRAPMEEDWQTYYEVLSSRGLDDPNFWFDVRGNHDTYGVPSDDGPKQFYSKYSVQGKVLGSPQHFTRTISAKNGGSSYNFVFIDGPVVPGITTPVGFYGDFDNNVVSEVEKATNIEGSAYTVAMSHFTHSTLNDYHAGLIDVNKKNPPAPLHSYLCGHLHSPELYSFIDGGLLELETADMRMNKAVRVMVYDHQLMSFVDTELDEWPIILITNPKDARFLIDVEPLGNMSTSTHIRVLVFEEDGTTNKATVAVRIDGMPLSRAVGTIDLCDCDDCILTREGCATSMVYTGTDHPLYTASWNPNSYSEGLHDIEVIVTLFDGTVSFESQEFSIDGSTASIGNTMPQILQRVPMNEIGGLLYIYLMILALSLVFGSRIWRIYNQRIYTLSFVSPAKLNKFQMFLSKQASLSIPSIVFAVISIVSSFGPMMILPLIGKGEAWCFVFVFGAYCDGNLGPAGLSVFYAVLIMKLFVIPSILLMGRLDHMTLKVAIATAKEKISTKPATKKENNNAEIVKCRSEVPTRAVTVIISIGLAIFFIIHFVHFVEFSVWSCFGMICMYAPIAVLVRASIIKRKSNDDLAQFVTIPMHLRKSVAMLPLSDTSSVPVAIQVV
eukprot:TRINITY_DN2916_c1_g3_i1.p1 TRINITY_DN2916_c1_g3~~TRINITY_DN2916_c1_g3_i1.p1  ORF type:complete len:722 (-),score=158.67 TRINITY_DN2916_c1_g3_i1:252-2417(-)